MLTYKHMLYHVSNNFNCSQKQKLEHGKQSLLNEAKEEKLRDSLKVRQFAAVFDN